MIDQAITIRPAENGDIKDIWDLLHANSETWSPEHIANQLDRLTVLVKGQKMLGVLCRILTPENAEVIRIVIHPMYPQKALKEIMMQGIKITQCQTVSAKLKVTKCIPALS